MRMLLMSLMLVACGEKTPPEAAAAEAAATEAAAAEAAAAEAAAAEAAAAEAAAAEAAAAEPPPPASNVDINMSITFADGSSKSGHVRLVEISEDAIADKGWSDDKSQLTMYMATGGTEKKVNFLDIDKATIKYGTVPGDTSCTYSSDWTPWMYDCTVKTTTTVTMKDGTTGSPEVPRRKWAVTFDDDTRVEFWLMKYSVFEQDQEAVSLDTLDPENRDLYIKLQQQLREELKTDKVVTSIDIQ